MKKRIKQVMEYKHKNCYCGSQILKKCDICRIINPLIDYLFDLKKKELDEDL